MKHYETNCWTHLQCDQSVPARDISFINVHAKLRENADNLCITQRRFKCPLLHYILIFVPATSRLLYMCLLDNVADSADCGGLNRGIL